MLRRVLVLGALTALGPLTVDLYLPAFPAIADDLRVSAGQVQLSLTAFLVGLAVGQLVSGPLSDRWGRRRLAVAGLSAYAILSFLIAPAPTSSILIVLRLLEGIAGGTGVVIARAVVRDLHSGVAAAKYFSRLTLIFGVSPVLAPLLGGVVLKVTSWHGIFVALGVIATLLTVLAAVWLPETLPVERRSGGRLAGMIRTAAPVFRDGNFLAYATAGAAASAGLLTYLANSSFVFQDGYGVSPTVYSLLFAASALALTVLSQANAYLLGRVQVRTMLIAALTLEVAAGLVALVAALAANLPGLAAGMFLLVGSIGMSTPNTTALALDRHADRAGAAAALLGGLQLIVSAVAAPLAGLGDPGHGVPMAALILTFAVVALLTVVVARRPGVSGSRPPRTEPRPSPPPGPA
jgi:DHA1 family bicyclomycin/chloramphenicol resistance-like MFS transporter